VKSFLLALGLLLVAVTAQAQSYLGYTTIGAGGDNGGNANYLVGSQFTAAAAGSITSGSLYSKHAARAALFGVLCVCESLLCLV
jgi:hypothetical protein